MALLLDTATLPPRERSEAVSASASAALGPSLVKHDLPPQLVQHTTNYWELGADRGLFRTRDTNFFLFRTPAELKADGRELFTVSFLHSGSTIFLEPEGPVRHPRGSLYLDNYAQPHEYGFEGSTDTSAFFCPHRDLQLPMRLVEESRPRLGSSPIYRMVQEHFSRLSDTVDELVDNRDASTALAGASVDLIRALVASTSVDAPSARDALHQVQLTTLLTYVRQHVLEPTLTPERIAAANHMSVRQLYKVWLGVGESLNDWILRERLDTARKLLIAPQNILVKIEVIARRCGFTDPSHFSRRFRDAYGVSPREWRTARARIEPRS